MASKYMRYSELSGINIYEDDVSKSTSLIRRCGISAPDEVIEQFYIDHNDDEEFLDLYGELDLDKLQWSLLDLETAIFLDLGLSATFPEFIEEVAEGVSNVIDSRENVVQHWEKNGTWLKPPILIDGSILSPTSGPYHLAEGHTRVGCLIGLAGSSEVRVAENHKAYYGHY